MAWFTKGLYYDTKYKKRGPSGSGTLVPPVVPSMPVYVDPSDPIDPVTDDPWVPSDEPWVSPPASDPVPSPSGPTNPSAPPKYPRPKDYWNWPVKPFNPLPPGRPGNNTDDPAYDAALDAFRKNSTAVPGGKNFIDYIHDTIWDDAYGDNGARFRDRDRSAGGL